MHEHMRNYKYNQQMYMQRQKDKSWSENGTISLCSKELHIHMRNEKTANEYAATQGQIRVRKRKDDLVFQGAAYSFAELI